MMSTEDMTFSELNITPPARLLRSNSSPGPFECAAHAEPRPLPMEINHRLVGALYGPCIASPNLSQSHINHCPCFYVLLQKKPTNLFGRIRGCPSNVQAKPPFFPPNAVFPDHVLQTLLYPKESLSLSTKPSLTNVKPISAPRIVDSYHIQEQETYLLDKELVIMKAWVCHFALFLVSRAVLRGVAATLADMDY